MGPLPLTIHYFLTLHQIKGQIIKIQSGARGKQLPALRVSKGSLCASLSASLCQEPVPGALGACRARAVGRRGRGPGPRDSAARGRCSALFAHRAARASAAPGTVTRQGRAGAAAGEQQACALCLQPLRCERWYSASPSSSPGRHLGVVSSQRECGARPDLDGGP
jgi:hypothetical protein